jgi:hypothetical protein
MPTQHPNRRIFVKRIPAGVQIESDAGGDLTVILGSQLSRITAVSMLGMEDDDHVLILHTLSKDIEISFYSRGNLRQAHEQALKLLSSDPVTTTTQ